jgi:hypothetical protein
MKKENYQLHLPNLLLRIYSYGTEDPMVTFFTKIHLLTQPYGISVQSHYPTKAFKIARGSGLLSSEANF